MTDGIDFGVDLDELLPAPTEEKKETKPSETPEEVVDVQEPEKKDDVEEVHISDVIQPEGSQQTSAEGDATAYFELLKEKGYLAVTDDYEFDGSWETLEQLNDDYRRGLGENIVRTMIDRANDTNKMIIAAALQGVDDIASVLKPRQEAAKYDVSTVDGQKGIITEYYKSKGISDDEITFVLERLEDKDQLEVKAKQHKENIDKLVESQLADEVKAKQDAEAKALENQQKMYNGMVKYAEDAKWNAKKKGLVFDVVKNIDPILTEIAKSPNAYMQLAELLTYYKDGKFDLDAIKEVKTKKTSSFKERLGGSKKPKGTKGGGNPADDQFPFDFSNILPATS